MAKYTGRNKRNKSKVFSVERVLGFLNLSLLVILLLKIFKLL